MQMLAGRCADHLKGETCFDDLAFVTHAHINKESAGHGVSCNADITSICRIEVEAAASVIIVRCPGELSRSVGLEHLSRCTPVPVGEHVGNAVQSHRLSFLNYECSGSAQKILCKE